MSANITPATSLKLKIRGNLHELSPNSGNNDILIQLSYISTIGVQDHSGSVLPDGRFRRRISVNSVGEANKLPVDGSSGTGGGTVIRWEHVAVAVVMCT